MYVFLYHPTFVAEGTVFFYNYHSVIIFKELNGNLMDSQSHSDFSEPRKIWRNLILDGYRVYNFTAIIFEVYYCNKNYTLSKFLKEFNF